MIRKFIATLSLAVVLSLAGPVIGTNPAFAGCTTELQKYKLVQGQARHGYKCRSSTGCKCSVTDCTGEELKYTCSANPPTSVKIDKPTPPVGCTNASSDKVPWKATWWGVKCTYYSGCLCFAVVCAPTDGKSPAFVKSAKCQTVSP
jgi:hypothetical protein